MGSLNLYVSTGGAVYGEPKILPVKETCPVEPLSQYGVSKHTVEHYLSIFYKLYGLNFTILRYPNVYGPRQSPHGEAGVVAIFSELLLQNMRPTIFGDGSKTRDYVYVDDLINANMIVMGGLGNGEIYNLGWGKEISDLKVFKTIKGALKSDIEPIFSQKRPGEIDHISLDSSKAATELNWRPKTTFEEGIKISTQYYRNLIRVKQ